MDNLGSRRVAGFLLLAAVSALPACGDSADPPPHPTPGPPSIVLQFQTGGGLAGPCCARWDNPDLTAYGDGRVIFEDSSVVREATVGQEEIDQLVADARDAGLLEAHDFGVVCCDMAYTRVVIGDAGTTNEFEVTGLGIEDEGQLSGEQIALRRAVSDLQDRLKALAEQSANQRAYVPETLAVYVYPSTEDGGRAWPLDQSLAEGGDPVDGSDGRCLLLTDADDIGAVTGAATTNDRSMWSSGGQEWAVFLRPLLPDEESCP
jgi:hypothetical protein